MSFFATSLVGFGVNGEAPVAYVGSSFADGASNTITWPAGTAAGDIAIIMIPCATSTVTGMTGFTETLHGVVHAGTQCNSYTKVLASGDVSGPPSYAGASSGGYSCVVYRGPTAITYKTTTANDSGTSISITGFVKASNSARVISVVVDRDPGGTPTQPSGYTLRVINAVSAFGFAFADIAPISYVDSATADWTTLANTFDQLGAMFELTS